MEFLGSRHQFVSYGTGSLGFLKPILTKLFYPFQGFWPQVLGVLTLLHTLFFGLTYMNMFLLATVAVHIALWYWLRKAGRKQINTKLCRGRDRIVGTARGVFDVSVVTHSENQIQQVLREERLAEDALSIIRLGRHALCVLASRHTDVGKELQKIPDHRTVPLAKLAQWELIGPDRDSGIRRQLESHFLQGELYFVTEGGGWSASKEYARVGLGVALVPLAIVTAVDRQELVCRRISKRFAITDFILHRRDDTHPFLPVVKAAIMDTVRRSG